MTVTNIMYKYYCLIQENAFVTPYKVALWQQFKGISGKCMYCNEYATQRHLLGGCNVLKNELIERHDIVVNEIYKKIIEIKLQNKYDATNKWIKLDNGFLESGKQLPKIIGRQFIEKNLKPDIVYCNNKELLLIEVAVCQEDLIKSRLKEKKKVYKETFIELKKLYQPILSRYIAVVVTSSGILARISREELKEVGIIFDEVKIMREILHFESDYLIKKNMKYNLLQNK